MVRRTRLRELLGPGILFAAGSVGVSHLVQSTRAGAAYGLGLWFVVLLANLVKYPAFRVGPHYAAATGQSLLEGYRRQGVWAVWLYGVLTVASAFAVLAGVTVVTAGLGIAAFGLPGGPVWVSAFLLAACATILGVGRFRLLDRSVKVLVAAFTAGTLVATAGVLSRIDWSTGVQLPRLHGASEWLFLAALFGWMPSAVDLSIWQSLWTLEREKDLKRRLSLDDAMVDFHVGYVGTGVLALCFVALGAGLMHARGLTFEDSAGRFAGQVVELYGQTLGPGFQPLIAVAAFAVMFSTTLAVLDGFPRGLAGFVNRLRGPEGSTPPLGRIYWIFMGICILGALIVLALFLTSLKGLIDGVTTLSFLTAPLLSLLNHRALASPEVRAVRPPAMWLLRWSGVAIALQAAFALAYLAIRYIFP